MLAASAWGQPRDPRSPSLLAWRAHTRLRVSKANRPWLHGIGCRVVGERLGSMEPIPRMPTVLSACTVTTVTNKRKPQSLGCARQGSCGLWARPQSLHRISPTHSCASVSLSASDTQGHLPPSWGQWWWLKHCFFGEGHVFAIWPQLWCGLKVTLEGERKCHDGDCSQEARAQAGAHSWPVSTRTTRSLACGSHTGPQIAPLPVSPLAAGTPCLPSLGSLCALALARLGSSVGVRAACA